MIFKSNWWFYFWHAASTIYLSFLYKIDHPIKIIVWFKQRHFQRSKPTMATDSKPLEALKKDDGIIVFVFPCFKCFCSLNPRDPYVLINNRRSIVSLETLLSACHVCILWIPVLVWFYHYLSIAFYVHSIFESMYSIHMGQYYWDYRVYVLIESIISRLEW